MMKLRTPIRFEQMDGSTLRGAPTTHVTKPVRLEIGKHWEYIRFLIVVKVIEPIILGLAWLDKWEPHHMMGEGFPKTEVSTWARTNGTESCGRSRWGSTTRTTGRHYGRGFSGYIQGFSRCFQ